MNDRLITLSLVLTVIIAYAPFFDPILLPAPFLAAIAVVARTRIKAPWAGYVVFYGIIAVAAIGLGLFHTGNLI